MSLLDTIETVETETTEAFNGSFSKEIPNLQIALDSTSIGLLKTCPKLYYYQMILGYGGPRSGFGTEESPHLKFGTLYHAASEIYDHCRADGYTHDHALSNAIEYTINAAWSPETQTMWESSEPTKTLKTLLRSLVWYFDHFQNDPLETLILPNGKPAVELSFSFNLASLASNDDYRAPSGEPYSLCGHLDRAARWKPDLWVVDKKTTKAQLDDRYFAGYNPDNQVSLYTIAGAVILHEEIAGVIIDAAQVLVNGTRFQRRPIPRTQGQNEEWLADLKIYLRMMEAYAKINYWPMNDKSCNLYGGCKFRVVCGLDPAAREDYLEAFYEKRTWDPTIPR